MEYKLIRSKRKTATIEITKEATILVRAPFSMSKNTLDNFVFKHEKLIKKRVKQAEERKVAKEKFNLKIGDFLLLAGKKYPIVFSAKRPSFLEDIGFLVNTTEEAKIKQQIIDIYKKQARKIMGERTLLNAEIMGLVVRSANCSPMQPGIEKFSIKITSAKKRWGSCSSNNNINFSWFLVMADIDDIDYIIIHELAHTLQHNHSRKFWDIVEGYCPNYKLCKARLKLLGEKQFSENWEWN